MSRIFSTEHHTRRAGTPKELGKFEKMEKCPSRGSYDTSNVRDTLNFLFQTLKLNTESAYQSVRFIYVCTGNQPGHRGNEVCK